MLRIKKTINIELFRTIRINIKRYISLILIIFLGVGFYVGMKSSSPSLEETMKVYYDDIKYMDLMFASEMGISEEDIETIKKRIPEIDIIEGGYYEDILVEFEDQETKDKQEYITAIHSYNNNKQLNRLKLREGRFPKSSDECIADASLYRLDYDIGDKITVNSSLFKKKELTITGFARSPSYISVEKGNSALLSGKIQFFLYVNEDNYEIKQESKIYPVVYARLKEKYPPFTEEYNQYTEMVAKKVEDLSKNISVTRREEIIKDKTKEINQAEEKYNEEKGKVLIELEKAKNELTKAESEIEKKEKEIMSDNEIDVYLSLAEMKLESAKSELDILKSMYDIADLYNDLDPEKAASIRREYYEALAAYNQGLSEYQHAVEHLKEEMHAAKKIIEKKKKELEKTKTEYAKKEKKLTTTIEKKYNEIIEAKKRLKELKNKAWNVFTRQDQYGYNSFSSDIYRIRGISSLFPIAFFLVAALVTSSTVSRLIQEERTKIGLLKSLGYGNKYIAFKYIFYSASAATIGILLGIIIGTIVFPTIFEEIYSLLYFLPDLKIKMSMTHVYLSIIFAFLSTVLVVLFIMKNIRKERPYMLMKQKPDEFNKLNIIEEKSSFWNKLSFRKKMTYRNILRKPRRSIMTIMGIIGCTALMITGFGIRDSITNSMSIQFKKIMNVSVQLYYKSGLTDYEMKEEQRRIEKSKYIDNTIIARQESIRVKKDNRIYNVFNLIPEDSSSINEMVKFKNVKGKKNLNLTDDGVIITQKLSQLTNLSAGDYLTYYDGLDIEHKVIITGVTENYVYDYVYMTQDLYKKINEIDSVNNYLFVKYKNNTNSEKALKMINKNRMFSNYQSIDQVQKSYDNIMEKFAKIIIVIIISSGLLAFIVLYNLSKMNISERLGEIATLKVLGYNSNDVHNIISSETKILTIIGIIFGMVCGYFLTNMVLTTCEVDEIMYYHGIFYTSYIYSVILTIIFAIVINRVVKKDLTKVEMVEVLKIRE